jgi:peptide/nickel transport system ATP-binding protein
MELRNLADEQEPILRVDDLAVAYQVGGRWLDAVREISLVIQRGQTYGLVGESGSGKTTIAMAIMGFLGPQGKVRQGKIEFNGHDLLGLNQAQMRQVWGTQMSLVPQNPLSALNPSILVGEQIAETLRHHQAMDTRKARQRTIQLLRTVRLPDPERVADSYPHQISGGMQQRVMIALAVSANPRLLVLDEPTTSLDVTTQASILDLFRDLILGLETSVLYVTHNLGVVAQICDRVAVLYAGELVEDATLGELFRQPLHPYTQGLLDSVPKLGQSKHQVQLQPIKGQIPPLGARPAGCVFVDRCPLAIEKCQQRPPLYRAARGRLTRCHRWEELATGQVSAHQHLPETKPARQGTPAASTAQDTVLKIEDLSVFFDVRRSLGEFLARRKPRKVRAVEGVSINGRAGMTLGLVGESGSGKTTLARAVVGLVERSEGKLEVMGLPLPSKLNRRNLETLRHLQMVFQNPEEALNPYLTVGASLRRPLINLLKMSPQQADREVVRLLQDVRLPADYARRMPGQLSGGEKQRIAIARAFASNPDLLVADEPVSSLDVSVQATVLNLLHELQLEYQSTLLLISHDLAVVSYLADEIAVIYLGHLMELSAAQGLFEPPYHPYTEALLSAIPLPNPWAQREHIRLEGDVPSPMNVPSGCPFHTRCPRYLGEICVTEEPPWRFDESTGSRYYCHIPIDELRAAQKPIFGASGEEAPAKG